MGAVTAFPAYLCKDIPVLCKQFLELFAIFHRMLADSSPTKGEKNAFLHEKESIMYDGAEHS